MSYTPLPRITLYFREGGSDKVYQADIAHSGGDFYHVHFAYGRRGSTLTAGRKTPQPVTLDEAKKVYDKVVNEKKAKGYHEGETMVQVHAPVSMLPGPTTRTEPLRGASSSISEPSRLPMLLNRIDEAQALKLLNDPAWGLQEKHDGTRLQVLVHCSGQCDAFNKLGKLTSLSSAIHVTLQPLASRGPCLLDGEAVGDTFYVFDLLQIGGKDLRKQPYRARLQELARHCQSMGTAVKLVHTSHSGGLLSGNPSKSEFLTQLKDRKAEGAVFKRLNAPWRAGRVDDALKFKFEETASFIVDKVNGKRSVALSLVHGAGQVNVGNVTIPPNKAIPKAGAIVEVRYLYAYLGGSIFQPVYLGERSDVGHHECHTSQLKYKAA